MKPRNPGRRQCIRCVSPQRLFTSTNLAEKAVQNETRDLMCVGPRFKNQRNHKFIHETARGTTRIQKLHHMLLCPAIPLQNEWITSTCGARRPIRRSRIEQCYVRLYMSRACQQRILCAEQRMGLRPSKFHIGVIMSCPTRSLFHPERCQHTNHVVLRLYKQSSSSCNVPRPAL